MVSKVDRADTNSEFKNTENDCERSEPMSLVSDAEKKSTEICTHLYLNGRENVLLQSAQHI